ncbi:MAG: cache domain-containing protein [Bacteroidales bacterium]|nr:cache domain-containing protein [Bacteroidales bacterium]
MRRILAVMVLCLAFVSCKKDSGLTDEELLDWNKKIAVAYVHSYAISIGEAVTEMSDETTIINYIRRAIDPISFYPDNSGYFYVYDNDCVNIAHARQKDLQGQNLFNYTDTRGKFVIRELAAMAQGGGGYVEFYWIKPGDTGEKKKLGYVEPIPNTNYFIGSGVYLE